MPINTTPETADVPGGKITCSQNYGGAGSEKTLESPLDCNEIQPVHPKGDQSWVLIGRTDAEAETTILWAPECKELTRWKTSDAGKD